MILGAEDAMHVFALCSFLYVFFLHAGNLYLILLLIIKKRKSKLFTQKLQYIPVRVSSKLHKAMHMQYYYIYIHVCIKQGDLCNAEGSCSKAQEQ